MTSVSHATRPAGPLQHRVEHGVGDLVGDLVGVSLGDGLRGEAEVSVHGAPPAAVGRRRGSLAIDGITLDERPGGVVPLAGTRSSSPTSASASGMPSTTVQTASVIGRSTPRSRRAPQRRRGVRPSTTIPTSRLRGSEGATPRASSSPAARLREWPRGAGGDEIAQAREARVGAGIGAERRAEARHLGQAARDQRRARVVAVAEPVADARGDRDHVLGRAAELHAAHVRRRVDAEAGRRERALQRRRDLRRPGSRDARRRLSGRDLLGVVRPGERCDRSPRRARRRRR